MEWEATVVEKIVRVSKPKCALPVIFSQSEKLDNMQAFLNLISSENFLQLDMWMVEPLKI